MINNVVIGTVAVRRLNINERIQSVLYYQLVLVYLLSKIYYEISAMLENFIDDF